MGKEPDEVELKVAIKAGARDMFLIWFFKNHLCTIFINHLDRKSRNMLINFLIMQTQDAL